MVKVWKQASKEEQNTSEEREAASRYIERGEMNRNRVECGPSLEAEAAKRSTQDDDRVKNLATLNLPVPPTGPVIRGCGAGCNSPIIKKVRFGFSYRNYPME